MWLLTSRENTAAGRLTFRARPGTIKTIGRATRADFIVDAALVSRLHCRLETAADAIHVVDLDSTNGTYVNDARITRAKLTAGDRLRVGRVEFIVSSEAQKLRN